MIWRCGRMIGACRRAAKERIESELSEGLGLKLKGNCHRQRMRQGMGFPGYRIRPNGSVLGRVARKRLVRRWQGIERSLEGGA